MAGLDIAGGSKRASNHQLPLVPFIDFLLCLVMFLLVTAVWSHMARLTADASVPGIHDSDTPSEPELHVSLGERTFELTWRVGQTVLSSVEVPRRPVEVDGAITYPDLIQAVEREWQARRPPSASPASTPDRAVLHARNDAPFAELSAVLDALHAPTRNLVVGTTTRPLAAFQISFSVN